MKNGLFAPNGKTQPLGVNHIILQPVMDFGSMPTQHKKKLISAFNFKLLHIKISSLCQNRKLAAP